MRKRNGESVFCPKAFSENDSNRKDREADRRVPSVRFKNLKEAGRARWRPRAAVVAGGDPRRGREIGGYLRAQGAIPRWMVVEVVAGKHHVGGSPCSGGRRFGRGWRSPERAALIKLRRGLRIW